MDLFILTSALDRSAAAITSASVVTPLVGPDEFPQLVLGTTEPMTVRHLTAASTYEAWTADPLYTMVVSLGKLTATGLEVYAEGTLATVITNGKGGNLALTTAKLADALHLLRYARATLTLQVTVTDSGGKKRVFAQLPITVVGSVPSYTIT